MLVDTETWDRDANFTLGRLGRSFEIAHNRSAARVWLSVVWVGDDSLPRGIRIAADEPVLRWQSRRVRVEAPALAKMRSRDGGDHRHHAWCHTIGGCRVG